MYIRRALYVHVRHRCASKYRRTKGYRRLNNRMLKPATVEFVSEVIVLPANQL